MSKTLSQRIDEAFSNSPHVPRRRFQIEANDGIVRIEGAVPTFFQKQMVQETVKRVEGVETVENRLLVTYH